MRYWIDTEFWERPNSIDLISIGIVAEDGRELYFESSQFDWERHCPESSTFTGDPWLWNNVRPHMKWGEYTATPGYIGEAIRNALQYDTKPEFWGYYADYDWVVFCWLQGRMIDLPKGWPMYCRDIKQMADLFEVRLPKQEEGAHDALADAWHHKAMFDHLVEETKGWRVWVKDLKL